MQFSCSNSVSGVGFFLGVEAPKVFNLFVVGDLRLPTTISLLHPRKAANAFETMFVVCPTICPVLPVGRDAKVGKSVVGLDAIDMVNRAGWNFSSHVKKRKTVRTVGSSVNFDVNVSLVLLEISGDCTDNYARSCGSPCEDPCFGTIGEGGFESGLVNHENDYTRPLNRLQ